MSHTIISVSVHEAHTRRNFTDADYRAVTRAAYSIDGYGPVIVIINAPTACGMVAEIGGRHRDHAVIPCHQERGALGGWC